MSVTTEEGIYKLVRSHHIPLHMLIIKIDCGSTPMLHANKLVSVMDLS